MFPQLQFSLYHKVLRVALCVMVCVLVFDSGVFSSTTALLSANTQLYLANAVSVSVGVPATEVNTLTAKIATLQQERDLAVGLRQQEIPTTNTSTFVLSGIVFILLVLVVLNYALDYARARERLQRNENNTPSLA